MFLSKRNSFCVLNDSPEKLSNISQNFENFSFVYVIFRVGIISIRNVASEHSSLLTISMRRSKKGPFRSHATKNISFNVPFIFEIASFKLPKVCM